jgi:hypothetical protein
VLYDTIQVIDTAVVVHAQPSVDLAGTGPVVPGQHVPAMPVQHPRHADHVRPSGMALEAVGQDGKLPASRPRPVKVEKVVVGREYPLALIDNASDLARHRGIEGLEVSVAEQKRRSVGGPMNYGHGLMKIMF